MDVLPIDTSHPAVREYLTLVRLQVLTPLSLLINIAITTVCATVVRPSLIGVVRTHQTSISPRPSLIALYVSVVYIAQIGYCSLLVLARKPETKRALTKAVGFTLVLANWIMPLWALAVIFNWWIVAAVMQGLLLTVLLYSNVALLIYHPPQSDRPMDTALIHAPLRFFLALPFHILFPYCLFVALGMSLKHVEPDEPLSNSAWRAWVGFAVVFSTNVLALIVEFVRQDIVWCIAATWLCASLWAETPKPAPVFATAVAFTVVHPLALFASLMYSLCYVPRRNRITLPAGEDPLHHGVRRGLAEEGRTPAEVNPGEVWAA